MPRASGMFKSDFVPLGLDLCVYVKEATITSAVDATYSEDIVILHKSNILPIYKHQHHAFCNTTRIIVMDNNERVEILFV